MRLTRKEERYIKEREIEPPVHDYKQLENVLKNAVLEWQRKRESARERAKREEMKKEEMRRQQRKEELQRQREYYEKY